MEFLGIYFQFGNEKFHEFFTDSNFSLQFMESFVELNVFNLSHLFGRFKHAMSCIYDKI